MSNGSDTPYGLSEVDDFAAKKEQVLLDNSSMRNRANADDYSEEEEEVMGISDESSGDEEEEEEEEELDGEKAYRQVFGRKLDVGQPGEEDDESAMLDNDNAWGSTKNEYYGADEIEDDEDAKEIEKEALRQQKKHLQELNMEDYLDDELDEEWSKDAKQFDIAEFQSSTKQTDTSVSIKDLKTMDPEAKSEYLKTMLPEYMPLCKELSELSAVLDSLKAQTETESAKLKTLALSSYLATISSYFGILFHELQTNEEFTSMRDHPVMETILTSKEVWRQASELPDTDPVPASEQLQHSDVSDVDAEDIEELDQDMLNDIPVGDDSESEGELLQDEDAEEQDNDDDADLDDFEEYVVQSRIAKDNNKSKKTSEEAADDFLEAEMNEVDAQEKKARRRTLRFYTSKIDQQSNKKLDKLGGDDDIPYKERLFERQQRLLEEARKRGLHDKNGADLDDNEYNSQDEKAAEDINNESTINYYKQIQKERQQRKDDRHNAHKTAVIAAREGKLAEAIESVGEDGKRAINFQILKNKGLTPKRKKDNRNARVKKRKKYEQAKKKLKSVRAVYSGGQSGAYEGEKTGIKKNLIRSVKFKN
ncbi:rRNA-processing protein [Maudiozyma humilis]|uniref:rRNA-processing protein n=1 Tax=Maudiozyma humilis TaxID=51915 RepID=A0AAV5RXN0_MAUHU|nr:rRNA-processing protein [Kazachstania humilis]